MENRFSRSRKAGLISTILPPSIPISVIDCSEPATLHKQPRTPGARSTTRVKVPSRLHRLDPDLLSIQLRARPSDDIPSASLNHGAKHVLVCSQQLHIDDYSLGTSARHFGEYSGSLFLSMTISTLPFNG